MDPAKLIAEAAAAGVRLWVEDGALKFRTSRGPLDTLLRAALAAEKGNVIAYLEREDGAGQSHIVPLTPNQTHLVVTDAMQVDQSTYNMAVAFQADWRIPVDRVERGVQDIVRRHEALRSHIRFDGVTAGQMILPPDTGARSVVIERIAPGADTDDRWLAHRAGLRFDLENELPIRVYAQVGDAHSLLLFVFSHIFFDGRSYAIFFAELDALLNSATEQCRLPAVAVQFADLLIAQPHNPDNLDTADVQYWSEYLASAPPLTSLPADHARMGPDYRGHTFTRTLATLDVERLRKLASTLDASLFLTLSAVFAMVLARWIKQNDLIIGSPFDTRPLPKAAGTIGFFSTLFPLRHTIDQTSTVASVIEQARSSIENALDHPHLALQQVLQRLDLSGMQDTSPLIQTVFALEQDDERALRIDGRALTRKVVHRGNVNTEFEVMARHHSGGLDFHFTYATTVFDQASVMAVADAFMSALCNPDLGAATAARDLVATPAENRIAAAHPSSEFSVLLAIARTIAKDPRQALFSNDAGYNFGDLAVASTAVATQIDSVRNQRPSCLALPKLIPSFETLALILGAWRANVSVRLPDADTAPADARLLCDNGQSMITISVDTRIERDPAGLSATIERLLHDAEAINGPDMAIFDGAGGTGSITHQGLTNLAESLRDALDLSATDIFATDAITSIEGLIAQLIVPLLCGGTLSVEAFDRGCETRVDCLLSDTAANVFHVSGEQLEQALTAGWQPPPGCAFLFDRSLPSSAMSQMLDHLCPDHVGLFLDGAIYGHPYCVLGSATGHAERECVRLRPIPGLEAMLVNGNDGGPVPEFAIGTVHIAPPIGAPPIGASANDASPNGTVMPRLLARWCGAELVRVDHQAALSIDPPILRHVQQALDRCMGPARATVSLKTMQGRRHLVASALDNSAIPARIRGQLAHLIPSHWIPDFDRPADHAQPSRHAALEAIVETAWHQVLQRAPASRHINFFSAGGHSLAAVRLAHAISVATGVALTPALVMKAPTVAGLAALIEANRKQADHVAALGEPAGILATKIPIFNGDSGPLSPQQRRIWAADQISLAGAEQSVPMRYRITGPVNVAALSSAIDDLVCHHAILRTTFSGGSGEPQQYIGPPVAGIMRWLDVRSIEQHAAADRLRHFEDDILSAPFDLERGPVFRAGLATTADDTHILCLNMHHIVIDAWSMGIVLNELQGRYLGHVHGDTMPPLPGTSLRYLDYAVWRTTAAPDARVDIAYWRKRLQQIPQTLGLPERPGHHGPSYRGFTLASRFDRVCTAEIDRLARTTATSPFTILATAFARTLGSVAQRHDVVIGAPVANRDHDDLWPIVGLFIDMMPMRFRLVEGERLEQMVSRSAHALSTDQQHYSVAPADIVRALRTRAMAGKASLFQAILIENMPEMDGFPLGAATAWYDRWDTTEARFALTLNFRRAQDGSIDLIWTADSAIFDRDIVERLDETLHALITASAQGDDRPGGALPGLSAHSDPAVVSVLLAAFDRHALADPDAIACTARQASWTYHDLYRQSWHIGETLASLGLSVDQPVGLLSARDGNALGAMLGVLRAGGAYVPLDPSHPTQRLRSILEDCGAEFVIADPTALSRHSIEGLGSVSCDILSTTPTGAIATRSTDAAWAPPEYQAGPLLGMPIGATWLAPNGRAASLAYILYTSGTTGTPKGVMVEQAGVVNYIDAQRRFLSLDTDEAKRGFLCLTSFAFDTCVATVWGALLNGRCVEIASENERYDLTYVADRLCDTDRFSVAYVPPALLAEIPFVDSARPIARIVISGEASSADLIDRLADKTRLFNEYGPTEASVCATVHRFRRGDDPRTIGRAIDGVSISLRDGEGKAVSAGAEGEIWIGGIGVARGYLGHDRLTQDRFLEDGDGSRWYRTGDWARLTHDGDLIFLGRRDKQIKLRGQRIELSEISANLQKLSFVRDALVTITTTDAGRQQLVAHLLVERAAAISDQDLARNAQAELAARLPQFMIPTRWSIRVQWPLTSNGKIDERQLDTGQTIGRMSSVIPVAAPSLDDDIGVILASLWQGLLAEIPGVQSNFFEAGGDSITALQFVARAAEQGLTLRVRHILEAQTFAEIAAKAVRNPAATIGLRTTEGDEPASGPTSEDHLPLLPMQAEFFAHASENALNFFNQSMLFEPCARVSTAALRQAAQLLLARHDALGLRFRDTEQGWRSYHSDDLAEDATAAVTRITLSDLTAATIEQACSAQQRKLDIRFGPLFKIVLLDHQAGQRILFVCHHLAVDAISWPLIMNDLEAGIKADGATRHAVLKDDYRRAVHILPAMARRDDVLHEIPYWKALLAQLADEPRAMPRPVPRQVSARLANSDLPATVIENLRSGRSGLALILAVLATSVVAARGRDSKMVGISIETHGRLRFPDDVDVSTAVGWFSGTYPVIVDVGLASTQTLADAVTAAQHALDHAPAGGVHFDSLRQSGAFADLNREPRILLNFFGSMVQRVDDGETIVRPASEPRGAEFDTIPMAPRDVILNCGIDDDGFAFTLITDPDHVSADDAQAIHDRLISTLRTALATAADPADPGANLPPVVARDRWLATGTQQGMVFAEQTAPGTYSIRLQMALRNVDPISLRAAFTALTDRHDSLRSHFGPDEAGNLCQIVGAENTVAWATSDLSHLDADARSHHIARLKEAAFDRPINPEQAPLHRIDEIITADHDCLILWVLQHTIFDGWSLPIAVRELKALHDAHRAMRMADLPSAPSFGTFARWHHNQDHEQSIEYWKRRLAGFDDATALPRSADMPQPAVSGTIDSQWDDAQSGALVTAARRSRCTPATLLRAAWALALSYFSGQDDVVFGVVQSGRPPELPEMQRAIGLFITTVPTRIAIDPDRSIHSWLAQIQADSIEEADYGSLPLHAIEHTASQVDGPLFQSIFAFENYPKLNDSDREDAAGGLVIASVSSDEQTNFGLTLQARLQKTLALRLTYDNPAIDHALAQSIVAQFNYFAMALCDGHAETLGAILRRPTLRETTGSTAPSTPRVAFCGIAQRFATVAHMSPDADAIQHGDTRYTYGDLDARAGALAGRLRDAGTQSGDRIVILAPRSPAAIVAMLAVSRIGAVFVPIDPQTPAGRIATIVLASSARVLLHDGTAILPDLTDVMAIVIDGPPSHSASVAPVATTPDAPAYIMFTSGSTGIPKGVSVPSRAIERLVIDPDYVRLDTNSRMAHLSNPAFDASTFEIWGALLNGGTLIIIDNDILHDARRFEAELRAASINIMFLTTALFTQFVRIAPDMFGSVDQLLFGGERLDPAVINMIMATAPPSNLIHVYGPTENTTFSTAFRINDIRDQYPIGRFIGGTGGAIVSDQGHPVPPGQIGELILCGDGLAIGYVGRPDLTDERFISVATDGGVQRFYKSGDLVFARADGTITFVGRQDKQLKLRGFRIEPGEIRAQLIATGRVHDAHIFATGAQEAMQLCAAIVPTGQRPDVPDQDGLQVELSHRLEEHLPKFMIPTQWAVVEKLPLTASGKIDEQVLAMAITAQKVGIVNSELPRDAIEHALLRIWSDTLKSPRISVEDDFYAIGGTSISAIKIRYRIAQELNIDLPLADFVRLRSIEMLAEHIRRRSTQTASEPASLVIPLKPSDGHIDVVCVHPAGGTTFTYLPLAWALPDDCGVIGIQAYGVERDEPLPPTIEEMARLYIQQLPDSARPRVVIGASFGGLVAYEIARQLTERGESVTAILLDSQATDNPALQKTITPVSMAIFREKLIKYNGMYPGISDAQIDRYFRLYNHHLMMLATDDLKPSRARTILVMATEDKVQGHQQAMADYWVRRTRDFVLIKVPGDHSTILEPPQLQKVIDLLLDERAALRTQG